MSTVSRLPTPPGPPDGTIPEPHDTERSAMPAEPRPATSLTAGRDRCGAVNPDRPDHFCTKRKHSLGLHVWSSRAAGQAGKNEMDVWS